MEVEGAVALDEGVSKTMEWVEVEAELREKKETERCSVTSPAPVLCCPDFSSCGERVTLGSDESFIFSLQIKVPKRFLFVCVFYARVTEVRTLVLCCGKSEQMESCYARL